MNKATEGLTRKKRVRYKIPTYKKVYSVYQYDQKKYNGIYKKLHKLALKYDENIYYRVNPYDILRLCYVRTDTNQLEKLGDKEHIFRYKAYHNILSEIANILLEKYEISQTPDVLKYLFKRTGLTFYLNSDNQSQVEDIFTLDMELKDKINYHTRLLRLLKTGMELEIVVKLCQKAFINSKRAVS